MSDKTENLTMITKAMETIREYFKLFYDDDQGYTGFFFNWDPPKNHKYGKKLKYLNWDPPKNHKYGKKLKYPNWYPPKMFKYGKQT